MKHEAMPLPLSGGRRPPGPFSWPLLAGLLLLTGGSSRASVMADSISVASCRASCLDVFTTPNVERDSKCRKNSDCFMCWNSCGILRHHVSVWTSMCTDHTACFPGCQIACGFYMDKALDERSSTTYQSTPIPRLPAYIPPPRVSEKNLVTWNNPNWSGSTLPSSQDDIIYVLLMHGDGGWREVTQTSSTSTPIPPGVEGVLRVRLMAVSQQGLEAVSEVYLHLNDLSKGHLHADDTLYHEEPLHFDDLPSSMIPYGYKVDIVKTKLPSPPPPTTESSDSEILIKIPHHTISSSSPESSTSHISDSFPGHTTDVPANQARQQMANDYEKNDPSPHIASMDPSWIIQIVNLHVGTLAEVTVAWAPRGSGKVEYLLSWVEESGFVSGHLLTDQVTSELSLWPGQGYHLQVELIDSQGNAVLKSLATPVIFHPTPPITSSATESSISTTTFSSVNTAEMEGTFPTTLATVQSEGSKNVALRVGDKRLLKHETVRSQPFLKDDVHNFMQNDADEVIFRKNSEINERTHKAHGYKEISNNTKGEKIPEAEVSAKEIHATTSEKASQIIVWCVGVGIGALLLLTLCSLVIWLLGRCQKSTQNEEYSGTCITRNTYEYFLR